jgi:hypothetical protein
MLRNLFVINTILVILAGFLCIKLYGALTQRLELPTGQPAGGAAKTQKDDLKRARRIEPGSFEIIASGNLFNPSRSGKAKTGVQSTQSPPPKNEPKLFGTIIIGDRKSAIIEDPESKSRKTFGLQDVIGGYVVSDIQEDKVVLLWGTDPITIRLRDDKGIAAPKRRQVTQAPKRTETREPRTRRRRPRRSRSSVPPPPPPGGGGRE